MEPENVTVLEIHEKNCQPLFNPQKFNTWKKLIKIACLVFEFLNKVKGSNYLNIVKPQKYWVTYLQRSGFKEVHHYLEKTLVNPTPNLVKNLNLFEHDGLIKYRDKIDQTNLSYHTKFPLLLPKQHHLTKLIILNAHQITLHGEFKETLELKENFCIPRGCLVIESIIKLCYVYKRLESRPYQYPSPPPLRNERVEDSKPFEIIGVDYTDFIK